MSAISFSLSSFIVLICVLLFSSSSISAQIVNYRHVELGLFPSLNFSATSVRPTISLYRDGLLPGVSWGMVNNNFIQLLNEPDGIEYKLILFIRHSEGLHNVAERILGSALWNNYEALKPEYTDSPLSDDGKQEAMQLQGRLTENMQSGELELELIVLSPLSRAIQTAEIGLDYIWNNNTIPKISIESARETIGVHYCDKRNPESYLNQTFPTVDFTNLISNQDILWKPYIREDDLHEFQRGKSVLDWLYTRKEQKIVLVAHGGILNSITSALGNQWNPALAGKQLPGDEYPISGYNFRNTEVLPVIVRRDPQTSS